MSLTKIPSFVPVFRVYISLVHDNIRKFVMNL